ncbi:Golgi-specific brefeldin A-resistance guanine nucleotide exchange factor 1 [Ostrinia nubilalis]|uniref:Golgi-specific brefeldin A-resistance guanine nucleotide exchange factor 1 n=1 Tax=Ostrinia nubilalis TaxID=29057 RepID=UPI00308248F4
MSLPGNGIFVVQGEMAMLVTAMRRSTRWGSHSFPNEEYDVLMKTFQDLKIILNQVDDLRLLDPATYLSPFLEVIRSKETTGPVTSLALSAIHKFLSYGLIDPTHPSVPAIVEDISDAVTHARFVGTDHSSDGVVLMKILQVLRTLMLSPEGVMLTDESVCEIMLSCFRICFETRLTELLRRNAEQCLRDMTQLIFMRLPQFPPEDAASASFAAVGLSLKKRDKTAKKKSLTGIHSTNSLERNSSMTEQASAHADPETDNEKKLEKMRHHQDKNLLNEAEITIEPVDPLKTPTKKHNRHSSMDLASQNTSITQLLEKCVNKDAEPEKTDEAEKTDEQKEEVDVTDAEVIEQDGSTCTKPAEAEDASAEKEKLEEYVNHRGIRFTPQEDSLNLQPYGLVCVRELFRFLISLCNPLDSQNTSAMVHLGLSLVGTALEVGADQLAACPSLFYLVRDPLCRNLLSLLGTERISIFALDLQVSFLLFEALRFQLKFQMEAFFKKIIEIISMDTSKAIYELKEIQHLALESLAQLFRIPGYCTELYLNYDCDVYCMNVFEELTKLLSKNVISSTAYNIHSLSLEVLLTIIDAIEMGTQPKIESKSETDILNVEEEKESKYGRGGHVTLELGGMDDASVVSDHVTHDISQYFVPGRTGRHKATTNLPTEAELDNIRNMKKWVTQGTELFNQKPERGIEFLQEHGVLKTPLDPHEVAIFLRENPDLDKKMIGEYICKRSSRGEDDSESGSTVLGAFADSFDYTGLRIDQALRLYLETFRLPGEAPLIFLVMEKFAERWHSTNGEPFANTDAAFRLAYAVIMLNMDQHNHNAKKLNVPMTVDDFVKNLRGCNGSGDFDQAMLEAVYYSIKNEEMVMPAERVGPVREAYLWRVLQRRGRTAAAAYRAPAPAHPHHARLFTVVCPCAVTALSAAFERAAPPSPEEIESNNTRSSAALLALSGLERCAALVARQPADALTVDTLLLTLCKFTALQPAVAAPQQHYRAIALVARQPADALTVDTLLLTLCKFTALQPAVAAPQQHYRAIALVARQPADALTVDTLLLTLCKFTALQPAVAAPQQHYRAIALVARQPADALTVDTLLLTLCKFTALQPAVAAPQQHYRAIALVARQPADALTVDTLLLTLCKFTALQPAVAAPQQHYRAIALVARQPADALTVDTLLLTLCKFTALQPAVAAPQQHYRAIALSGLERCAALVARQPADALTVDTLLLTLCKFTALQPAVAAPQQHYRAIGVTLGQSSKAQLALRRACAVAARHADCVRDAWKYLLDIVTTLFVGRLLPKSMVEVEDYLAPNGTVSLLREAARGSEAGLLSSIYSYIALGESGIRTPTPHEKSLIDIATDCVAKCNLPGLLVTETKFLQLESLQELVRAMVVAGTPPDAESLQMNPPLEDVTIFYLELLEQTLIQNRDRLLTVWDEAGPHIRRVVTWSASRCGYTLTRTLTALLRSAARLMRCDHCAAPVLQHLRLLLQLPHKPLQQHTPAISCGLYDIVKTSAQNVHSADEWRILFALLCAAGAGAWPVGVPADAQNTTSSRSEGSEDESERRPTSASSESELSQSPQQGWILVKNEAAPMVEGNPGTGWWEDEQITLRGHRTAALARCCEALALVVRDVAHVTPYNCRAAVRAVRIFARATLHDAKKSRDGRKQRASSRRRDDSSDEEIDTLDQYHLISIQLLDLMHTLHSRTAQIFKWWRDEADQGQNAEEYDLWEVAWMPLLQGIAEFCTDRRKQVSNSAIAYLQRALLVPGLSPGAGGAGGAGGAWEACFQRVLFPLLERLPRRAHIAARANTIMCKVFLQHLSALSPRASFTALWLRVIDVQASLVAAGADDALTEAALESLKNMILVMDSVRIFSNGDNYNELWYITWEKIGEFLPNLKEELFPQVKDNTTTNVPAPQQPLPSMPTLVPVPTSTPSTLIPPHPLLPPHNQTSPQHTSPVLVPTSPVNLGQSPPKLAPTLVAPTPVSGMVPIRNQLYDQAGLTSSVLLQPLNEMISTPIGISIQSQMPILYPQTAPEPLQTQISPEPIKIEPNAAVTPPTLLQPTYIENIVPDKDINQSELYAEYLINPYNEAKDLSAKEATLYDPESQTIDQTVPDSELRNPLLSILDKQKALSTNTTPMHTRNKTQFGSTDNLRPDSGIFNFSSYFSSVNERGSEVFDTLMSTQEG